MESSLIEIGWKLMYVGLFLIAVSVVEAIWQVSIEKFIKIFCVGLALMLVGIVLLVVSLVEV